ncbi:MAG: transcription termination factor NusA [Ardenticatenaceae bacterium]
MRKNEFMRALNALCAERNLSKEVVFDAIESALQAAYRRDFEQDPNVTVSMDRTTGVAYVYVEREVVERVENDRREISLEKARRMYGASTKIGDIVREEQTPRNFGRIAAQTAKQVILQRIREAERDRLYHDYASREGELVMGMVQSIDNKTRAVRLTLGKVEALLPRSEQLPGERYRVGLRIRAYVAEVNRAHRGPQITVSRTHRKMLRRLLELEVPEITTGTVELRAIAREAGARSKVAVVALQTGIDPVGACVGMKGTRIQNIVNELNGEKIDIVQWSPDEAVYVANSLSPAKVIDVFLDQNNGEGKTATVVVPDKLLSLAIGKEGQNARLAAKLTGWRIDIKSASETSQEQMRVTESKAPKPKSRRMSAEEARIAAARALLAEAEAMDSLFDDDDDDDDEFSMAEVDEMAFDLESLKDDDEMDEVVLLEEEEEELALADEEDDLVLADEEDDLVLADEEDDLVLADEEDDLVLADEEDDVVLADEEDDVVLADEEDDVVLADEEDEIVVAKPKALPPAPDPLAEEEDDFLLADDEDLVLFDDDEDDDLLGFDDDIIEPVSKPSRDSSKKVEPKAPSQTRSHSGSRVAPPAKAKSSKSEEQTKKGSKNQSNASTIFYTFNTESRAKSLDNASQGDNKTRKKKKKKKKPRTKPYRKRRS